MFSYVVVSVFFNDSVTARDIMDNFRPNKLEELGRKIRNYDLHSWSRYCRSYLRQGNFAKFSQNPNIRQQLIDNVRNGELVYAVVDDCLLGVGLKDEDGRLYQKKSWKGKNLLGRALMEVRDMLMKNEQTLPEIVEDLEDEAAVESSYSSQGNKLGILSLLHAQLLTPQTNQSALRSMDS